MPHHPAKLLIASNNVEDAAQVQRQLTENFDRIATSLGSASAVRDFEQFKPDVVVLVFDSIEAAQSYSLGLFRLSNVVKVHPHRTVLLCSNAQLRAAFDLCKSGVYDDYVLHWPLAHDGLRLTMSVLNAARIIPPQVSPTPQDIRGHTKEIAAMDSLLRQQLAEGEGLAARATESLKRAEREVGAVLDSFSEKAAESRGRPGAEAKDVQASRHELARVGRESVVQAFKASSEGLASLTAWPTKVKEQMAPHLSKMGGFSRQVHEARRVVLVVDDDEFARDLVAKALESQRYDLLFAHDAASALGVLRRVIPSFILMDVNLPDMDGVLLTRTLKAARHLADIPVLMLTGAASRENLAGSISAGAAGFIVKPFTRDALLARLEGLLPSPG